MKTWHKLIWCSMKKYTLLCNCITQNILRFDPHALRALRSAQAGIPFLTQPLISLTLHVSSLSLSLSQFSLNSHIVSVSLSVFGVVLRATIQCSTLTSF